MNDATRAAFVEYTLDAQKKRFFLVHFFPFPPAIKLNRVCVFVIVWKFSKYIYSRRLAGVLCRCRCWWCRRNWRKTPRNQKKGKRRRRRRKNNNGENDHFIPKMKLNTCAPAILCSLLSSVGSQLKYETRKTLNNLKWVCSVYVRVYADEQDNMRETERERDEGTHKENYRSANLDRRYFLPSSTCKTRTHMEWRRCIIRIIINLLNWLYLFLEAIARIFGTKTNERSREKNRYKSFFFLSRPHIYFI